MSLREKGSLTSLASAGARRYSASRTLPEQPFERCLSESPYIAKASKMGTAESIVLCNEKYRHLG
jgi:hypothetical protein